MPVPVIHLGRHRLEDLSFVCCLEPGRFADIVACLCRLEFTLRLADVKRAIESIDGKETAKRLGELLSGLALYGRRTPATAEEICEGLSRSLPGMGWNENQLQGWERIKPRFTELLRCDSVMLSAKASDLSGDVSCTYLAGRIVTDIRPVFDEARSMVRGGIVMQALHLDFIGRGYERNLLTLCLDTQDIRKLQQACAEALAKAETAHENLERNHGPRCVVTIGSDFDE